MNRTEFIVATAVILFLAFLTGWVASWLVHRLNRVSKDDIGQLDHLAQSLHEAEETRDQALAFMHEREAELNRKLTEQEAELTAAMEGLRDARAETEELRSYIEKINSAG